MLILVRFALSLQLGLSISIYKSYYHLSFIILKINDKCEIRVQLILMPFN